MIVIHLHHMEDHGRDGCASWRFVGMDVFTLEGEMIGELFNPEDPGSLASLLETRDGGRRAGFITWTLVDDPSLDPELKSVWPYSLRRLGSRWVAYRSRRGVTESFLLARDGSREGHVVTRVADDLLRQ